MMKRLLTAVLSSIIFAALFSSISYVPHSQREPNVYYFGFLETFIFVIIYAGSVYLLAGLPFSVLIDRLTERVQRKSSWAKYFVGLGLYSLAGILVGAIFNIVLGPYIHLLEVISFSIYGFVAANIYFHLLLLISKK